MIILKFQLISNKIAGSGFRYYLTAELLNVETEFRNYTSIKSNILFKYVENQI